MKTPLNRSADGARMQPGAPLSSLKSPAMTGNIVNKEPPMQDTQCLAIRDWLFDQHDRVTGTARLFRYVAVVPNDSDVKSATVHYALARPVPITGTFAAEPDDIVRELLAQSPFRSAELHLAEHDVLKDSWPVKWGLTAKDSLSNWPVLVLSERDDKSVYGVVMRSPNLESNALRFASLYCDPEEVGLILDLLMLMQPDDAFLGWFKESEIAASDLEQALAATPQTDAGQKFVLLYRTDEWLSGIWNADRPIVERINLTSLADFHGIPVSLAKKRRRADLEQACDNQTVTGDYDALVKALTAAGGEMPSRGSDYEADPAVRVLCDWWNGAAPDGMRHAGALRIYVWSDERRVFLPGDPEEPGLPADVLATQPTYALFQEPGKPTVAVVFLRGREHNVALPNGSTQIQFANGNPCYVIALPISVANEAFYPAQGLRAVRRFMVTRVPALAAGDLQVA